MKNILLSKKTTIILLIVAILSLGLYSYMLLRPISYGMSYQNETVYDGGTFVGTMEFLPDGTMINRNTNFDEEMESRYYYKNGYVFFTMAQTDEEYEKEIASINENFDEAIKKPFYADKINAFKLVVSEDDGFSVVYKCRSAVVFAIAGGAVELLLIAITCVSFYLRKKTEK